MSLRAGVAVRDISPRAPLFLAGYPHAPRTSAGTHDLLTASALYLSDGTTSLLLISVDVLFITRDSTAHCREAIERACGVPAANILISATHTHSAPVTATMLAWREDPVVPEPDAEYIQLFHQGIVAAATAARREARPAELAVTTTRVNGVGCNRLSPDGPFDAEAGVLLVRSNSKPMAISVIYGMHPTVLHEDSRLVSADFPHYTRKHLAETFPGLETVYHTAPCGNLSPRHHVRGQTFAEAERLGRALGGAIADAVRELRDEDFQSEVRLAARRDFAELVPNVFPSCADAEALLREAQARYLQLKIGAAPQAQVRTAECVIFGCEERLTLARAQMSGETKHLQRRYRQAEVQAFLIGDTCLIGLPGEQFVEYSLGIKRAAPARTFVIGLANGELQGYIVTPETGETISYEGSFALFAAESGRRLVNTALRLVGGLCE